MSASKIGLVSFAGLTTIGVLLSNVGNAQAATFNSCRKATCVDSVTTQQGDALRYDYTVYNNQNDSTLDAWYLPLLGIQDITKINDETRGTAVSGTGWELYNMAQYQPLLTSPTLANLVSQVDSTGKGKFSDTPWVLAFEGFSIESNASKTFSLISTNGSRNVPYVARLTTVITSAGYGGPPTTTTETSYEVGDPLAPSDIPVAPTPFIGLGLAAVGAQIARRKRELA
jgi:hypothetical protein